MGRVPAKVLFSRKSRRKRGRLRPSEPQAGMVPVKAFSDRFRDTRLPLKAPFRPHCSGRVPCKARCAQTPGGSHCKPEGDELPPCRHRRMVVLRSPSLPTLCLQACHLEQLAAGGCLACSKAGSAAVALLCCCAGIRQLLKV